MYSTKYLALVAIAVAASGCALERADPSARSSRTTYGPITVVASGEGAKASLIMGDGATTAADGEGTISQPSTQTTTQNPDLSGAAGGLSPIGAGIAAATQLGGKIVDATKEVKIAKENTKVKKAEAEKAKAEAQNNCPDGNCTTGDCPDGNCTYDGCPDGNCSYDDCPDGNCSP